MPEQTTSTVADPNAASTTVDTAAPDAGQVTDGGDGGDGQTTPNDPYHGMSREQVIAKYEEAQANQSKLDERQTAISEQLATLLTRNQERDNATQQVTTEDKIASLTQRTQERWVNELEDGGPEKQFEMLHAYGLDLLDIMRAERNEQLQDLRGSTTSRLRELDPTYQANKEKVDTLASMLGGDTDKAIKALDAIGQLSKPSAVSQPGAITPPGTTRDGGSRQSAPSAGKPLNVNPAALKAISSVLGEDGVKKIVESLSKGA